MNENTRLLQEILATLQRIEIEAKQGASRDYYQWTPEGLPICPRHEEVMPKREKQGDIWHSHQVIDENGETFYCRGYKSKSSPGWEIKVDQAAPPPPAIDPMDLQRTTPVKSQAIAEPVKDERLAFYELGSAAVGEGTIGWDKFNSIARKAGREGWVAGIAELQVVLG